MSEIPDFVWVLLAAFSFLGVVFCIAAHPDNKDKDKDKDKDK